METVSTVHVCLRTEMSVHVAGDRLTHCFFLGFLPATLVLPFLALRAEAIAHLPYIHTMVLYCTYVRTRGRSNGVQCFKLRTIRENTWC